MYYSPQAKREGGTGLVAYRLHFNALCFSKKNIGSIQTASTATSAERLLCVWQASLEDPCTLLLEFFSIHIAQPRRGLFNGATRLDMS